MKNGDRIEHVTVSSENAQGYDETHPQSQSGRLSVSARGLGASLGRRWAAIRAVCGSTRAG